MIHCKDGSVKIAGTEGDICIDLFTIMCALVENDFDKKLNFEAMYAEAIAIKGKRQFSRNQMTQINWKELRKQMEEEDERNRKNEDF